LEITIDRGDDGVTLVVRGEIDLESSAALADALATMVSPHHVSLDLTDVAYMDSTGLRTILVAKEDIERGGGTLGISAASNIVARLVEITGVDGLLTASD